MKHLKQKEKQAYFLRLYEPNHEGLLKYCESITQNPQDAEDIVGETVLIAYQQLDKLKKQDSFKYYLFGIARNLIRRKHRRQKFWGVFNQEKAKQLPSSHNPELSVDVRLLYEALDLLPMVQKEAIILFELSGYSIKEIAEIQASGISAVKARLVRGRQKLSKLLSEKTVEA